MESVKQVITEKNRPLLKSSFIAVRLTSATGRDVNMRTSLVSEMARGGGFKRLLQ
jgi:hypothetical protein